MAFQLLRVNLHEMLNFSLVLLTLGNDTDKNAINSAREFGTRLLSSRQVGNNDLNNQCLTVPPAVQTGFGCIWMQNRVDNIHIISKFTV